MKSLRALFAAASLVALSAGGTLAAEPQVVTSIKPVHSLVAAVMEGVGEPGLILQGAGSPHTDSLRPSQARMLAGADLVFWVGPDLEAFLAKPVRSLAGGAKLVTLSKVEGLTLLEPREGGAFETHGHDDEDHDEHEEGHESEGEAGHEDHGHHGSDVHIWLDPQNARAMARAIAEALSEVDPEHAAAYAANAAELERKIDGLESELTAELAAVRDKPFIVFHDAYQYFEKRFGLAAAGSITVSPEVIPGAQRVEEIHAKVKQLDAACVFAEPQFEPRLIEVVIEGTDARSGVLDPLGAELTDGPGLYFDLLRGMARSLKDCLSAGS